MSISLKEFENIFNQNFPLIKNFIFYKTGDIALSEDIVQETFIKLWKKREDIKIETVKNLLYTIASNLSKNHIKHQHVVLNFIKAQKNTKNNETPQDFLEEEEFKKKLQDAISSLPEIHRTTFLMNRIDKITYKQIAIHLNISVKTVEKRMSIALKHLYQRLNHKL